MKKITETLFIIAAVMMLASCSNIPDAAESKQMKAWVYTMCLDYSTKDDYVRNFIDEEMLAENALLAYQEADISYDVNKYLSQSLYMRRGMFNDENSYEACFYNVSLAGFYSFIRQGWRKSYNEYISDEEIDNLYGYAIDEKKLSLHKSLVAYRFAEYVMDLAEKNIEIIECKHVEYDENFQRYMIIYRAKDGGYAKLSFVIFDDDRYECQVVKKGDTLMEVK